MMQVEGVQCRAVDADEVECLLCSRAEDPMKPFHISPHTVTCNVHVPVPSALGGAGSAGIKFRVEM